MLKKAYYSYNLRRTTSKEGQILRSIKKKKNNSPTVLLTDILDKDLQALMNFYDLNT